jgi:uncharacterized protein (TIGR02300 family)
MAKADLGEKRRCLSCTTLFFDLNRNPIVCPKCAAVFQVVEIVRSSTKYARPRPFEYTANAQPDPSPAEVVTLDDESEEEVESALPEAE